MLHYASGKPENDDFQVVENQLCRQRLFSVHPDHNKPLGRWIDDLQQGIHSFHDQLDRTPSLSGKLARADKRMRDELSERGRAPDSWVSYEEAFQALSDRLGPGYPKRIMLDSGAFTDWGKGKSSKIDDVIRSYHDFIERAGDLFDEIWMINLDVITDDGMDEGEKLEAINSSDKNFEKLKAEFGTWILPVFHQGEDSVRLSEVIDMADGYICLSPNNDLPEKKRTDWVSFYNTALPNNTRCHGLATTGNRMMRISGLYSGDSTSWKTHGGNGAIDVRWDEARTAASIDRLPLTPYYQNIHVSIERNEHDGKRELPNNKAHISELPNAEQEHAKARAEQYLPFPMVQLDRRAMSIVSLGEIQSVAEDI